MILFLFLLFFVVLFFVTSKEKEGMKPETNIPANLFQTWSTKHLPRYMKACVSRLKRQNPEFTYFLYDDDDCRQFIQENFEEDVLEAFDTLIPGAYKADLWRYCILYKKGGIYMDIKYECYKEFKLTTLLDKPHYVSDRKEFAEPGKSLVYNGFIVSPVNNPVLKECIHRIVKHVKEKDFRYIPLYQTGPGLLGEVLGKENLLVKDIDLEYSSDATSILWNGKKIIHMYPQYRDEQYKLKPDYYVDLWKQGLIYHP